MNIFNLLFAMLAFYKVVNHIVAKRSRPVQGVHRNQVPDNFRF